MADVFGDLSLFSEFDKNREAEGTFIHYDEDTERSRIIFEGYESDDEEFEEEDFLEPQNEQSETGKQSESDTATASGDAASAVKEELEDGEAGSDNKEAQKDDQDKEETKDKESESVNGNLTEHSKNEKQVLLIENDKAIAWLNDQLHEEAAQEATRSNISINQVIYEKNKFKRFCKILDSTRCVPDEESPAVQLLFNNNSFSRKYRQQIEQFIKGLLWNEFTSGAKMSEAFEEVTVRPGAPSCIEINDQLKPDQRSETMRQKHTFIGGSQFHNKFLIDFLGWPFSMNEPIRCNVNWEIPLYTQIFNEVFADPTTKPKSQSKKKPKPSCWNCGTENHSVAECRMPRNPSRIAANKKEFMEQQSQNQSSNKKFTGATRYHLDPDIASKFAKFQPGQISESLTKALGLRNDQLPQHIYNMRLYGYPPGWLQEAKQIQSNVNMFDKNGRMTLTTGQCLEDGELDDETTKESAQDYDINKIIEYPGFTVPTPDGFVDEYETHSLPPIQDHQLKDTLMKQSIEKATARKRKRAEDKEEKKKAEEEAKRAKLDGGENGELEGESLEMGELSEEKEELMEEKGESVEKGEEAKDTQELEPEEDMIQGQTPVLNKSSLSSCISISKDYGTPILVREKSDLPDASKFGVGVEEHIPFENLPNSTGTFEKMKDLIDLIRKKKSANV